MTSLNKKAQQPDYQIIVLLFFWAYILAALLIFASAFDNVAYAEFCNQFAVFDDVFFGDIIEQCFAFAYEGDEGAARSMVFFEGLEVLGEVSDAEGEERNLSFRRTCVGSRAAVLGENFVLFFFSEVLRHGNLAAGKTAFVLSEKRAH